MDDDDWEKQRAAAGVVIAIVLFSVMAVVCVFIGIVFWNMIV
jgi:hypothetical protein